MKKILVANRGEIACRIIDSCKKLNLHSIAVYSDVDKNSKHVRKANESIHIGASKDEEMCRAIADAVTPFNVSIFGMANTAHEKIYKEERKLDFVAEFYADLDYDKNGKLVIAKGKQSMYDSKLAVKRCLRAVSEKKVKTTIGTDIDVGCDTICVHSDTPNAVEIITKLKNALSKK